MRNRKYRYNPLADNIDPSEIRAYVQPIIQKKLIDKTVGKEGVRKALLKKIGQSNSSFEDGMQYLIERAVTRVIPKKINALEEKIQRLALEMAVKEAKDQYGVDISEQLYEKFGVARSNPRRTGRGRRYRNRRNPASDNFRTEIIAYKDGSFDGELDDLMTIMVRHYQDVHTVIETLLSYNVDDMTEEELYDYYDNY